MHAVEVVVCLGLHIISAFSWRHHMLFIIVKAGTAWKYTLAALTYCSCILKSLKLAIWFKWRFLFSFVLVCFLAVTYIECLLFRMGYYYYYHSHWLFLIIFKWTFPLKWDASLIDCCLFLLFDYFALVKKRVLENVLWQCSLWHLLLPAPTTVHDR